jgi:hypothetical protein
MSNDKKKVTDFPVFDPEKFKVMLAGRTAENEKLLARADNEYKLQLLQKAVNDRATVQLNAVNSICNKFICLIVFLVMCVILIGHSVYGQYQRTAFLEAGDAMARSIRSHPMFALEWRKRCDERALVINSELKGFRANLHVGKKKGFSLLTSTISEYVSGEPIADESSYQHRLEVLDKTSDEILETPVANFNADQTKIYNQVQVALLSAHKNDMQDRLDQLDEGHIRSMPANVIADFIRKITDVTVGRLSYVHVSLTVLCVLLGIQLNRPTQPAPLFGQAPRHRFWTILMVVLLLSAFVCFCCVYDRLSYLASFFQF